VYAELNKFKNGSEIASYLGFGENLGVAELIFDEFSFLGSVPGCNQNAPLDSDGKPFPPGLNEITDTSGNSIFNNICDEIDTSGDPIGNFLEETFDVDWDWYRAEPKESGMGYHGHKDNEIPFYGAYLTSQGLPVTDNVWQYGPASAARIEWIFQQCKDYGQC
jgi:hypothetical protein